MVKTLKNKNRHLSVGELEALLKRRRGSGSSHLCVKVKGNVAQLLLDVTDDLSLGGGDEVVTSLGHELGKVISDISSGKVESHDGVRKGISWEGVVG